MNNEIIDCIDTLKSVGTYTKTFIVICDEDIKEIKEIKEYISKGFKYVFAFNISGEEFMKEIDLDDSSDIEMAIHFVNLLTKTHPTMKIDGYIIPNNYHIPENNIHTQL